MVVDDRSDSRDPNPDPARVEASNLTHSAEFQIEPVYLPTSRRSIPPEIGHNSVKKGTRDANQLSGSLRDLSPSNVGHFEWVQSDIQGPRYGGKGKSRNNRATRRGRVNGTIRRQRSRMFEMRYFYACDQVDKKYFLVYWHPGAENLGDYGSKHHAPAYNKMVRPIYIHKVNSPRVLVRALSPQQVRKLGVGRVPS